MTSAAILTSCLAAACLYQGTSLLLGPRLDREIPVSLATAASPENVAPLAVPTPMLIGEAATIQLAALRVTTVAAVSSPPHRARSLPTPTPRPTVPVPTPRPSSIAPPGAAVEEHD